MPSSSRRCTKFLVLTARSRAHLCNESFPDATVPARARKNCPVLVGLARRTRFVSSIFAYIFVCASYVRGREYVPKREIKPASRKMRDRTWRVIKYRRDLRAALRRMRTSEFASSDETRSQFRVTKICRYNLCHNLLFAIISFFPSHKRIPDKSIQ